MALARAGRGKRRNKLTPTQAREQAQDEVVRLIGAGYTIAQAAKAVGRSENTLKTWRRDYPSFADRVDAIRERREMQAKGTEVREIPDFPEFCADYIGYPLPAHQRRFWDVINGRTPDDLPEKATLQWGGESTNNRRCMNLTPPDHGKSTVWSVFFPLWQIYQNPNIRILILSETQELANQFLFAIQRYLKDPSFEKLRAADPAGGWQDDSMPWTAKKMYVRGRDTANPDPTIQALGRKQQIYGRRCDIMIVDDLETMKTANQYQQDAQWIAREADSRLRPMWDLGPEDPGGLLLVVGTRVAAMDVYRWLRDEAKDGDGSPGFTVLQQPAILNNPSLPSVEWEVLWPARMHKKELAKRKGGYADQRQFQLIYQQNDISDEATFPAAAVDAATSRQRFPGKIDPTVPNNRPNGMEGLYITAGLDPATVGGTAMVVIGADRFTMKRYVLDVLYRRSMMPNEMIREMKRLTTEYGIKEWRVERNAFQRFLTQLDEVKDYMNQRGVLLTEHMTTGQTKWDEDWGVTTLVPLFMSSVSMGSQGYLIPRPKRDEHGMDIPGNYLIELPKAQNDGVKALIEQLKTWEPEVSKHHPTDCVMALWFAEIAAREFLQGRRARVGQGSKKKFMTPYMQKQEKRFSAEEYRNNVAALNPAAYGTGAYYSGS